MTKQPAPYGNWESPITAELVASGDGRPAFVGTVGDELWWNVPRPAEGGRRALLRRTPDGDVSTVLPLPWNTRNRVQEYGGTPWTAVPRSTGGPLVVFTHFDDQRLYAFQPDAGTDPRPLTPEPEFPSGLRMSAFVIVEDRNEVWGLLEEFTGPKPTDVRRLLIAVPLDGSAANDRGQMRELTDDSYRFVTGPRISSDGQHVAWLAWNHPDMPWDTTELRLADLTDQGELTNVRTIAGGGEEAISQVEWEKPGTLLFASDRTGWWNLYRHDLATGHETNLTPADEEFAGPLWASGSQWFAVLDNGHIATIHGKGESVLGILDPATGTITDIDGPWTDWLSSLAVSGTTVYGLAGSATRKYEVVAVNTADYTAETVANHHRDKVDPALVPEPEHRTFDGDNGREVHALVYSPQNPDYTGPENEKPPFVVWVHGGPTSHVRPNFNLEIAYFTSRGIGVVNVNYGGSTSYGREYRNRLREQWGNVDVEDCAAAARGLVAEGKADPDRLAIRGGSAGGWTSAASLTSPATEGLYACATIQYPILDLDNWIGDETHDFESQDLHSLIGPYDEVPERYRERSPVNHADRIKAPFILQQGLEDAICPPIQSERLLNQIAGKGVPHAYLTYEGEQHGFRRKETIIHSLLTEHSLYAQTFGFDGPTGTEVKLQP